MDTMEKTLQAAQQKRAQSVAGCKGLVCHLLLSESQGVQEPEEETPH